MEGIDIGNVKIGQSVAISGVGSIGSIILNMILLKGAGNVTAIDPVPEKRDLALKMGVQYVIDPNSEDIVSRAMEITDGRGFDRIFEVSGAPVATPPVLKALGNKGKAIYFAVYPMDYELPVNLFEMYCKEAGLHTVYTSIYNYPRVMDLIPRMDTDKIIGAEFPLDDAVKAFDVFQTSKYPKIVVAC